jgi:hypothetical protein
LLADDVVRRRISQDTSLNRLWQDRATRDGIGGVAAGLEAQARMMRLARAVMDDPAVQRRIDVEPRLGELWADDEVRRLIRDGTDPQP